MQIFLLLVEQGFLGVCFLESLAWIRDEFKIGFSVTVLTRDPSVFIQKYPHLANLSFLNFQQGDIRSFEFSKQRFTHMIHAATEASAQLNAESPLFMFDTISEGTRRALDFAVHCNIPRFLLISSGAVYGQQPPEVTHISEDYRGSPDLMLLKSAYGEGKRVAEYLCAVYADRWGIEIPIARCFAFVGPYLPLNTHFAIGNFIRDALIGRSIRIGGDGTPFRSYLYGADLVVWLWVILMRGTSCRSYNVGSEVHISINELAHQVVDVIFPGLKIEVAKDSNNQPPERYVPSTQRAQVELGLKQNFSLQESILRTAEWHRDKIT